MFAVAVAALAAAQLSDSEMQELEESLRADEAHAEPAEQPAAQAQSSPLALSLVLDAAASWFDARDPRLTGAHDPTGSGATLQELELYAFTNIDPFFRLDAAAAFGTFGAELEEAYATTLALPLGLQARAGLFLTRFGRLNEKHPHAWQFTLQPLAIGRFLGAEGDRGAGLEMSWLVPLPWYVELIGSATYGGEQDHAHGTEEEAPERLRLEDARLTAALEQFFAVSDDWSILWGLSAAAEGSDPDERVELAGTDLYIRYRPLDSAGRSAVSLQIEAIARRERDEGERHIDGGGYAELVWDVSASFGTGLRAEYVLGDEEDPLWPEARSRYAAMVAYRPSHFSRLRLEGTLDRPEWRRRPIYGAVLQLEIVGGAHGSHGY